MVVLPSVVRFLTATTIAAVFFINTVDGHGTEVRRCITPDGYLRFFVEHWHGDLSSATSAGTMTIRDDNTNQQSTTYPVATINNQGRVADTRWGCIGGALPTLVKRCINESYRNDWVYYEYPVTCNQQVSYTLLSGNTVELTEACAELYPATVSGIITDSSAPVPKINGQNLPYTITVMAGSTESTSAVVTFTASATDDCDANPLVTTTIASGSSFPLGDTQVTVTATDNQSNVGTNTLTVRVISPPTTSPTTSPTQSPSSRPSTNPSSYPSISPSISHVPSSQPSENPSESNWPTSQPSENPSISYQPSEQPSIVEETTTITGNLNLQPNMCTSGYTEAEQAAMCSAVQQTIQDLVCSTDDCEIQSVCCGTTSTEQRDRSLLSSRKLQETWQFQYEITETFTCEVASCDSPADTAAVDSILTSVADPMSQALADDTFVTILASNVDAQTLAVSPTCLVAWGAVGAPETVVSQPADNGVFYPDWKNDSGTCLQDGEEPGYMRINPTEWLSNSLEDCCEKYYSGWNKNKCMNEEGSGLWYVDHKNNRCVVDCEQGNGPLCGGVISSLSEDLFAEPKSCCETHLGWIQSDFCEAESLRTTCYCGTKEWYRGDSAGSDTCVQDCDESCGGSTCGGIVKDNGIVLNESAEKCCTEQYAWIEKDLCTSRSTKTPIGRYYPDLLEGKCVKDSETPTTDLSVSLYDTVEDCCADIDWLTVAECAAASGSTSSNTFFTFKYFVDWKLQKCVNDNGEDGIATKSDELFDSEDNCCAKIWWVDEDKCVYEAETL